MGKGNSPNFVNRFDDAFPHFRSDALSEAILSACVFQGNVVEDVVHSGQKMAEEALFPVK